MIILKEGDKSKTHKGPFTCPECGCQFLLTRKEFMNAPFIAPIRGKGSALYPYDDRIIGFRHSLICPDCETNFDVVERTEDYKEDEE